MFQIELEIKLIFRGPKLLISIISTSTKMIKCSNLYLMLFCVQVILETDVDVYLFKIQCYVAWNW